MYNTNYNLMELINDSRLDSICFIDREEQKIVVFDEYEVDSTKKLLRLPYEEELIDENKVLGDYIWERNLDIPKRMSARCYIRKAALFYDFVEYKRGKLARAFSKWLREHQVEISLVA